MDHVTGWERVAYPQRRGGYRRVDEQPVPQGARHAVRAGTTTARCGYPVEYIDQHRPWDPRGTGGMGSVCHECERLAAEAD